MNCRILKALGSFALCLVLCLGLATPLCSAAEATDASSSGYLVILNQDLPEADLSPLPVDLMGQATLLAAGHERRELLPLAEDLGIYKANDLSSIQNLVWSGQVQLTEPDYEAQLLDLDFSNMAQPNDDYFASKYQFNLTDVGAQTAWDAGLTGEGVTVAVIDSGLNVSHVDAPVKVGRGRYYYYREEDGGLYTFGGKQYNYYSSDYVVDSLGHGSMVSGIIAANTNNRSADYTGGVAGMAPNVTLLPIRCFTNEAGHLGGYVSNLISGIIYARDNGAKVINMSWGILDASTALKNTINSAANAGCILIAAAGNNSSALQYPAAYDNVIGVGSTDKTGALSDFSARNTSVAICAPGGKNSGQQIYSLWYTSDRAIGKGDGTSYAAPVVTAAAALLKEQNPTMTQADFLALLKTTSDPVSTSTAADSAYTGYGRLNLANILDATGYAGAMLRYDEDGVTVRAAYHPKAADRPAGDVVVLLGVYNEAGHLLDSDIAVVSPSDYNAYAHFATFDVPGAAVLRAFFLDSATLNSVVAPVEKALVY